MSMTMNKNSASILLIGNELLNGDTRDKNAWFLALRLAELGIKLENCSIVPDDLTLIVNELDRLSNLSPLIFTCGGIGPTSDDMTREAIAKLKTVELEQRNEAVEKLNNYAKKHNRALNQNSFKQAMFPQGSVIIPNIAGTADAFLTMHQRAKIISLPGVPKEVASIFEDQIIKLIPDLYPELDKQHQASLRLFGLSESYVGTEIDKLNLSPELTIAYRPHFPELLLVFNCTNKAVLDSNVKLAKETIGRDFFYSENKKDSLANTVIEILKAKSKTIAFAESCTGGLLANALVEIPGASSVFLGSAITYSNQAKKDILGVACLEQFGAVSRETAREMAQAAQNKFKSDYALSITGIAGPDGGTAEKPVGTIFIGLASPDNIDIFNFNLAWDREQNRIYSAYMAIELLRRKLLGIKLSWERK